MLRISVSKTATPSHISRLITNAALHIIESTDSTKQPNINMTDRFDAIEKKFGIAAYASPHEGFAAVVKARYSDFIVHESKREHCFTQRLLCLYLDILS
jgi:hypothetical protein